MSEDYIQETALIQQAWQEKVHHIWFEGRLYHNVVQFLDCIDFSNDPADYWTTMKRRLKTEGFQATKEQMRQFEVKSPKDRRTRKQDYATRETLLRLIQSISHPKVEPWKLLLAQVVEEQLQQLEADKMAQELEASRMEYRRLGRDEAWIERRIENIAARNALTDEWDKRGPLDYTEYSRFTSILHRGALGISPSQHKAIKGLKSQNIRDHMDQVELALSTLAEVTAATIHQENNSYGVKELEQDVQETAAGSEQIRLITERSLGRSVVSAQNFLPESKKGKRNKKQLLSEAKQETLFLESGSQLDASSEENQ